MPQVLAAMILSAGLGTRLAPLTDEVAKPMVPIGDAPAIAHVLARVRLAYPTRIVVNVHHRPDDLALFAEAHGLSISREPELLGTAGGLAHAGGALGPGDLLVWNGDILSDLDPSLLVAAHREHDAVATLAVTLLEPGEGNVGLSPGFEITRLRGERFGQEGWGAAFTGISILGPRLRAELPERGCLVGDVLLPALRRGVRLRAFVTDAGFSDIGSLRAYVAANRAWLERRGLSRFVARDAVVDARVLVESSIVGAGATVASSLVRSVVWPGATVPAGRALHDAVVTPRGIVSVGTP